MRFEVNLGLKNQTVPLKIENGKVIVTRVGSSAFFAAPNPLPHPTLASITILITGLETAYNNAKGGNKATTQALKAAEAAYDNAFIELSHYVEDRANNDPTNGLAIIDSANMVAKNKGGNTKADFKVSGTKISGTVKVSIKAVKGAAYNLQMSANPTPPTNAYVWQQAAVSSKCTMLIDGLTPATKMWFRYCRIIKGVQQNWSDPMSVIVL